MKGSVAPVFMAVLVLGLLMVEPGQGTISCDQVKSSLSPCYTYLTSGGSPSGECCGGLSSLAASAGSPDDRKAACECVKAAARGHSDIREDLAAALPKLCGVQLGKPVSKDVDCSK
ncbi:hypothetical protein L6164_031260 [Bauhinia variegata]|uniref:Uncharacterized protein n=1 Tax=Bauhinia variegata TaxID=167791 RepID=A0ACB9LFD6_BAUVA|nr:hypothetical protein L6164_031260 [Bauhinia variegata]